MRKPILYQLEFCPGVRAVRLMARIIDVELELYPVNLLKGENLSNDYFKINPQQTVPSLDDNGLYIWDSHAISQYLIEKYSNRSNELLGKDPFTRARISQRLHFDTGVLFNNLFALISSVYKEGAKEFAPKLLDGFHRAYGILNTFLSESSYLVGDHLTLADVACLTTTTSMNEVVPIDDTKYPNIVQWISRLSNDIPDYDVLNKQLAKKHGEVIHNLLMRNKNSN